MKRSKLLACLLVLILCFGMLPSAVLAEAPAEEPPKGRLGSGVFDFRQGEALNALLREAENLPDAYDLRRVDTDGDGEADACYVTPVRLQNPYGTCWGFSVVGAAESSLLSSGLAAADGYDENTLDLSEKHVAFFATSSIDDPTDPQYGEGTHFRKLSPIEQESYSYRYNTGGVTYMATSLFASGIGPLLEREFDPETGELVENEYAYKGANGEVAYWVVATQYGDDGKAIPESYRQEPVWYSNEDDWYMPDEYRFRQDYRLKDSLILPCPNGEDENGDYEFHPEAVEVIKQQIATYHRAVSISFEAESYLPGQDTSGKKFMSENWAHYTNVQGYSNHAVTIVGYDDNYPRTNFNSSTAEGGSAQPEGDGAFLVKNSWGSEMNDFPTNGFRHWGLLNGLDNAPYDPDAKPKEGNKATGYFWISYYDRSLSDPEAFIIDKDFGEAGYLYIDQMDFINAMYFLDFAPFDGSDCQMANVLTAKATSRLREISVLTAYPGTKVAYDVYLLGEDFTDPTDGILIEKGEATFEYGGYHRIELESKQVLSKGQQYAVVIRETEACDYVCYSAAYNRESQNLYNTGVVNPGESFFCEGGVWMDASESETQEELLSCYPGYTLEIDNFPIKAYLEPITYPDGESRQVFNGYLTINNWAEGNPGTFKLVAGESKTLTAEFRGIGKDMPASWNPTFEWVSTDGSVLKIENSTPGKGQAVITGLKPGVTQLVVYAGDGEKDASHEYADNYGVRVLTICVYENPDDFPAELQYPGVGHVGGEPACIVDVYCKPNASGVVAYGARYDADGRFLGVETMEVAPGETEEFSMLFDGASEVRFFVLDDAGAPACKSEVLLLSEIPQ